MPGEYLHISQFCDLRIYRRLDDEFETVCTDLPSLQKFLQKILFVSDHVSTTAMSELQVILDYFSSHSEQLKQWGQ